MADPTLPWWRNPKVQPVVLLGVLFLLSMALDVRGTLGTDSGGKIATLVSMERSGTLRPDVGYWAAPWDPEARVHGLIYTTRIGDQFVNVTTLPMVVVGYPLYRLGGTRLALLLPMLGSVLVALAARRLDRRMAGSDGAAAFWLVGLASPTLVYALDFWEHSLGLACMAWGVVFLMEVHGGRTALLGGAVGALFGLGFSMRTESLVYFAVAGGVVGVALLMARAFARAVVLAVTAAAGFGALVVANLALEQALLGTSFRSSRAAVAASAVGADLQTRIREGYLTAFSPFQSDEPLYVALSLALVAALAGVALAGRQRARRTVVLLCAACAAVVYLMRFSFGLGFIPGLVPTWPLAAAGVVLGVRDRAARILIAIGLLTLPVAFAFQYPGGALPQWGGRYVLTSGLVLTSVGFAHRAKLSAVGLRLVVCFAAATSIFGWGWLVVRTHAYADLADRLESRPEDVLIADNGFLAREFGATYGRKRWLAPSTAAERPRTLEVATASGAKTIGIVQGQPSPTREVPGFVVTGVVREALLPGADVFVVSYQRLP